MSISPSLPINLCIIVTLKLNRLDSNPERDFYLIFIMISPMRICIVLIYLLT